MKDILQKLKGFFSGLFDRSGSRTMFVAGIFIGIIIGYFGHP